jgi:hypothetical protein
MAIDRKAIKSIQDSLSKKVLAGVKRAAEIIVKTKEKGGKVSAVIGSGPNLHEGVTTLIAELMHKGIIDGVSTSSAVINHEMAGTLEKVKRIDGLCLGFDNTRLPSDGRVEVTILSRGMLQEFEKIVEINENLYRRMRRAKGDIIIKVAGNMAYPSGLYTERIARDVLALSRKEGTPFEFMAGLGADHLTMIGAGAALNLPVLVTVPQLVGGGEVGLCIGDSLSISERCRRIADLLEESDVIIESAIALSQEVHDGPFERFTGHGIWADWEGVRTFSLADKKIIRIDLDTNLEKAWWYEHRSKSISNAVQKGLPKTKDLKIPFRMEMSGFARIPGSLPIVADIGDIWPLLATMVADLLGVKLDFMCYNQSTLAGEKIREWIVKHVRPIKKECMIKSLSQVKENA